MKKTLSIMITLALVLGFSVIAVPAGVVGASTSTIDVTQPVQVTSNSYYERGQSIIYDGYNYWLFYGRSALVQVPYSSGNPDINDYQVYYKKASTVAGLAAATAMLVPGTHNNNIFNGETTAAYQGGKVRVFAARDEGATFTLYQFYYDGSIWNESTIKTGMGEGHAAAAECNGDLWLAYQMGSKWTSKYWDGSWHGEYDIIADPYGTAKFYVEGTNLYFVRADANYQDIFKWNGSSWSLIDTDTEPLAYDPTIYKIGSNYVCAYAPWDGTKQWIKAEVGTSLSTLLSSPTVAVNITAGGYSSNAWVDMWPAGFTDNGGNTYLFYTSERDPSDPLPTGSSDEIAGNIWYLKVDWPVTNDHYTYIQNAIDAATSTTIYVAPGTYPAGLTIDKPLNIIGSGSSSTFLTGGIKIAGSSSWSGLLLQDLYLKGDYGGNAKDAVIDLNVAPQVSDFTIKGCVLDGEGDSDRMAFYGDKHMSGNWTWEGNEIKAFRSWFLIDNTDSCVPSAVTYALGDVVFKDNWIHDCYGSIAFRGKAGEKTSSIIVSGNTFEDYPSHALSQAWAAIEVNIAASLVMYDNSIDGVPEASWGGEGQALQIWGIDTVDIYCNSFTNCYQGIWVFGGSAGGTYGGPYAIPSGAIYNNNIVGNSDYGIAVENTATGGPLNAENNWWGDTDGSGPYDPKDESGESSNHEVPEKKSCGSVNVAKMINDNGTGDKVWGLVDYCPWFDYHAATTTGAGNASLTCSHGCIRDLEAIPTPPNPPVYLPYGMFSFNISCISPGETVTLTITLPGPVPMGSQWWKYRSGAWYSLPIGSDDGDNIITLTLTDGVFPGDTDSIAGQITDPGGPGFEVNPFYRLDIFSTEGGSVNTPGEGTHRYVKGDVVELVASPDAGYKFVEWIGDTKTIADVHDASTTITIGNSLQWEVLKWSSITAKFAPAADPPGGPMVVQYVLTVSSAMGGSVTSPGEAVSVYDAGTVVSLVASPDYGYKFVNWAGDDIMNADFATTSITMNADHTVKANFEFEQTSTTVPDEESSGPLACFIATAAYGTPTAEQIDVLREFRDAVLLESAAGSQFVDLYYQLSPPIADFIAGNELLRTVVRELLVDPIVGMVEAVWRN